MNKKQLQRFIGNAKSISGYHLRECGVEAIPYNDNTMILLLEGNTYKRINVGLTETIPTWRNFLHNDVVYDFFGQKTYIKVEKVVEVISSTNIKYFLDNL